MKAGHAADKAAVLHMIESAELIRTYTVRGRDAFLADRQVQDAVVRNFEVMGEAAKRVSAATRGRFPQLPWRQMAGFRDILIHQYDVVVPLEVWNAVENDLATILEGAPDARPARGVALGIAGPAVR